MVVIRSELVQQMTVKEARFAKQISLNGLIWPKILK